MTDINSLEQLRKLDKIKPFGHSEAPKKKIMTDFAHFPCPGENYLYRSDCPGQGKWPKSVIIFF